VRPALRQLNQFWQGFALDLKLHHALFQDGKNNIIDVLAFKTLVIRWQVNCVKSPDPLKRKWPLFSDTRFSRQPDHRFHLFRSTTSFPVTRDSKSGLVFCHN
jgi:hypothetical protein